MTTKKNHNKDNRYRLQEISIKEIINKYPDKYVGTYQRGKHTVLTLDTCKIVFRNDQKEGKL
jgi:hypothetical protein